MYNASCILLNGALIRSVRPAWASYLLQVAVDVAHGLGESSWGREPRKFGSNHAG